MNLKKIYRDSYAGTLIGCLLSFVAGVVLALTVYSAFQTMSAVKNFRVPMCTEQTK